MSVMLLSSFSLSNLLRNVDNGDGGSLVAGVLNLDSLKKVRIIFGGVNW